MKIPIIPSSLFPTSLRNELRSFRRRDHIMQGAFSRRHRRRIVCRLVVDYYDVLIQWWPHWFDGQFWSRSDSNDITVRLLRSRWCARNHNTLPIVRCWSHQFILAISQFPWSGSVDAFDVGAWRFLVTFGALPVGKYFLVKTNNYKGK